MLNQVIGRRYTIIRHLGGRGSGQTFLAADQHLPGNPLCVVKQLKPKVTESSAWQTVRRLFNAEAEVLYALGKHDQIPRLFAHFEENQEFYLVQEFVEGHVLSEEFKQGQRLLETEAIDLLQDILHVLKFVHQQQVIHQDIKPSNLMRRQSDGKVILIDFGAVKQIEAECDPEADTIAARFSGYSPNEPLAGKPNFSSDIYAVGRVGLQALTGVSPQKMRVDPRTGEILWREGVEVSPDLADVLDTMIRCDYQQRYQTVADALSALKALNSKFTAILPPLPKPPIADVYLVWLERGDELFQVQRYREAIVAYEKVIQANPEDYLAWFKRGITLENLRQFQEALIAYDRVVEIQPNDYLAWFKRGGVLENLQRFEEALGCYEKVVLLQPENYWAWHDQGKVLETLQRFEAAVEAFDRAVHIKPNFQLAVESRKRLLSRLKQVDVLYDLQPYDDQRSEVKSEPSQDSVGQPSATEDYGTWFQKGQVLEKLQRHTEAVIAYNQAVQLNPNSPEVLRWRGNVLFSLKRYEEAIGSYDRAIQLQPNNSHLWRCLASALIKLKRYQEAAACLDKAIQLQPDSHSTWYWRGRVLVELKRYSEALCSYDRAIAQNPDFQPALRDRETLQAHFSSQLPAIER
jgi:tetratricopeptide (TPR) repeat protein